MRYLALRRRADLLLAGLGADRSRTLVIEGGLPDDYQAPPTSPPSPADSDPEPKPAKPPKDPGSLS
jgi:hypothetical protein